MKDFNTDWYDENFSERSFINGADLENHIKQHSYGESFDARLFKDLKNHQDFNVLYFIYDYQAYFNLADIKPSKEAKMKLVGSYEYQKTF